jgi:hypothetical protein
MDQIELKRGIDHRVVELPPQRGEIFDAAISQAKAVLDEWQNDGPRTAAAPEPELATAGKKGGQRARPSAKRPAAKKKARR